MHLIKKRKKRKKKRTKLMRLAIETTWVGDYRSTADMHGNAKTHHSVEARNSSCA